MHSSVTDDITTVVSQKMGGILGETPAPDQDFFLSGGDSVRAVELITVLVERYEPQTVDAEKLGAALLLAVFEDASPIALAEVISAHVGPA